MSAEIIEKLFDSETKTLIIWNLIIRKELTAKELAYITNKDISTINRTLNKMKKDNFIQISRTEEIPVNKANFQVNYWKVKPQLIPNLGDLDKIITEFLNSNNSSNTEKIKILFESIKGIMFSAMTYKLENMLQEKKISPISFLLFDEQTGKEYEKAYWQFMQDFLNKYHPKQISIDKIDPTGYLVFNFTTQIQDAIKHL